MILIGVDAGGTGVRAVAMDDTGRYLGRGQAGPGSPHNVGPQRAAGEIARAVAEAAAGRLPDIVATGVAGLEDASLRDAFERALRDGCPAGEILFHSDAAVALEGAFPGRAGIVVIAGTGSVAWGRRGEREARAGGWGHVVDDAGSGYDIARRMLAAVLRAHDGRGPATALAPRVLAALGIDSPEQIVGAARTMDPAALAALARHVFSAADGGDTVARTIVAESAREQAAMVSAVYHQLEFPAECPVAGVGGLFTHPGMRDAFTRAVRAVRPQAAVTPARLPPVGGALVKAFLRVHGAAGEELLRRLEAAAAEAGQSG